MSYFSLISPERKKTLTNEVIGLLMPAMHRDFNNMLHSIFLKQSAKNNNTFYFRIVYKNKIFEDHFYSGGRCTNVSLHPSLHKVMDEALELKSKLEQKESKIKSLMSKIFLRAKSESDAYKLLPTEMKDKMSLVFDLSEPTSLTDEDALEFFGENTHIMQSIYEKIFVGQLTGKL